MSTAQLDPDLLRAFIAVADHRSFTDAAASLNRTQSAVSTQIKRLEDQLGLKLFARSTNRVDLSVAGEGLVSYARRILSLGEEAIQRLRQHEIAGQVRLGVMDDYGTILMPPILKAFCNSYPGIELHMETGLTSGMTGRVGKAFDVVVAMHAKGEKSGELLRRERAVWAGSPELNVRDIDPLPVALYPNGCLFRDWTIAALDRSERRWRIAFISHSHGAVEAIVAQGLAVTVVKEGTFPRSLRMLGSEDGLPALPTAEIRLHVSQTAQPPAILLAQHLRDHFKADHRRAM
ncbi:LysR substrate-binding domain-containing protein [Bradyrhizobium sp. LjRoot220]|uniref:LysR family transcriptional regulator n=1 Tax=Bradyrhizobium sp. LjRoot220 TaxID=3342284 RepID=UPI003ED04229